MAAPAPCRYPCLCILSVQIKSGRCVPQCLEISWAALDAFYAVSSDYDPISKALAINDLDATDGLLDAFFAVGGGCSVQCNTPHGAMRPFPKHHVAVESPCPCCVLG